MNPARTPHLPTTLQKLSRRSPDSLFVLPLGVGNAFSTRFYNASFLVLAGGSVTLVDAPAPLGRIVHEALDGLGLQGNLEAIDNLFLTHLHGDHCNGVEELGFWRLFLGTKGKPGLHLLEELVEPLWEHRLRAGMGRLNFDGKLRDMQLSDYFRVQPFAGGAAIDLGVPGLHAETFPTRHGIPCAAVRFSYRGASLGYSADTPFDPLLIEFLSGCDMIIHETSPGEVHTPYERLMELDEDIRSRMHLIHLSDVFPTETSAIAVLKEGELYQVRPRALPR